MRRPPKETAPQHIRRKIRQLVAEVEGKRDDELNWHNLQHLFVDGGSCSIAENSRRKN